MNTANFKYYRVYKNETAVTEVTANDFKPRSTKGMVNDTSPIFYTLPADNFMFFDYPDKVDAMENAKAGALRYIYFLIKEAENCILKLKDYRDAHYEDLNINLLDSNIRRLEKEMNIK